MIMKKSKSSLSKSKNYYELGEFWDNHDLAEYWEKTTDADFEMDIKSEMTYYAVDKDLAEKIQLSAQKHGIPAKKLLSTWIEEKLKEEQL